VKHKHNCIFSYTIFCCLPIKIVFFQQFHKLIWLVQEIMFRINCINQRRFHNYLLGGRHNFITCHFQMLFASTNFHKVKHNWLEWWMQIIIFQIKLDFCNPSIIRITSFYAFSLQKYAYDKKEQKTCQRFYWPELNLHIVILFPYTFNLCT
jgi:hypothetical protein